MCPLPVGLVKFPLLEFQQLYSDIENPDQGLDRIMPTCIKKLCFMTFYL
jgi:hypothetical protein